MLLYTLDRSFVSAIRTCGLSQDIQICLYSYQPVNCLDEITHHYVMATDTRHGFFKNSQDTEIKL